MMAVATKAEREAKVAGDAAAEFNKFFDLYQFNPYRYVREVYNVDPYPWQTEALEAYRKALTGEGLRRISIRSGHGVGKTALLAWCVDHHQTFFLPQKTVCTAASEDQLFTALATEIKLWMGKKPPILRELFEIKSEIIENKSAPTEGFVSFRVSRAERPESLAGIHSKRVLLVPDEASGIPDSVFESAGGSMSSESAITILAGNMVRNTGYFYETHFKPAVMERWHRIHVSCIGAPGVSKDFIEDIRQHYGDQSNVYRVRVLGEPPLADEDTVIPFELAELALKRDVKGVQVQSVWGVDCARFGSDASALAKRRGNVLEEKVRSWYGIDTMQLVGRVKAEWDMTPAPNRPSDIMVDVIGIGAGVADRLKELQLPARGINVSETPAIGERFRNLRSELWFKGREWFEKRDCNILDDEKLRDELVSVRFKVLDSTGRLQVESKQDMKARGLKSPNLADAFLLTLASDAGTALGMRPKRLSWKVPLQRVIKGLV